MLTHDYKKVAAKISKNTYYKRKDIESVQLAVADCVKTVIEGVDFDNIEADNIRVKGLGIFKAQKRKIEHYIKHKK